MKTILSHVLTIFICQCINAQVGIGTTTPNSSAMLEISSNNKGVLLPRIADTSTVSNPVKGLLIFSNKNNKLWYYDGNHWQQAVSNAGGMDSIWYKAKDSLVYTAKEYVGINTNYDLIAPQANMQVNGSLLVQKKFDTYSITPPTAAQTYVMNNTAVTQSIPSTDSVFRIQDPGGTNNYGNNMQGNIDISVPSAAIGMKLSSVAADFGLGTGDTLWISEISYPSCRSNYTYRFTSTSVNPGDIIINRYNRKFIFRSDNNGNNGKGFNFIVTMIYGTQTEVNSPKKIRPIGNALYFSSTDGSFSSGANNEAAGTGSITLGSLNKASGNNAIVLGLNSEATDDGAIAIGTLARASAAYAVALGGGTAKGIYSISVMSGTASGELSFACIGGLASGDYSAAFAGGDATANHSFAVGASAIASANNAIALGSGAWASGDNSIATGYYTEANGANSGTMGYHTIANGYASVALGVYNDPILSSPATNPSSGQPIFIIGNGTSNSDRSNAMVALKNGNVGIGTNTPNTQLHIAGGTDASLSSGSGYFVIGDIAATNIVFDNNEIIARNNGATSTLFLQNSGGAFEIGGTAAKPGGGSWAATSDARLKENVKPYSDGLQTLLKIKPVYYNYNKLSGYNQTKQYIGVLAQELKEVAPYMVGTFKKEKDSTEYYNVDNTAMTYMLINAVKEQQEQIKAQQKQIDELKSKLEILLKK